MAVLPLTAAEVPVDGTPQIGGIATVRSNPTLRAMLIVGFFSTLVTAPLISLLLPAHFQRLGQPDLLGFTLSAFAAGSLVGSLEYTMIATRSRSLAYVLGIVVHTIGMAGFAVLDGFWIVAVGSTLVGIGGGLLSPIFMVYFAEQIPEAVRGRVLGLFNALALASTPIGLGGMALALTAISLRQGAVIVFVVTAAVMAFCLASPAMRAFAFAQRGPSDQSTRVTTKG